MDLSNYTDEELMRIRDGVADEPEEEQPSAVSPQPPEAQDPDAELKRRLAYVAERGDRENERRQAQNAVNWLSSNSSASLGDENAEKMRAYADQLYIGTKERTNDFTKEERRERYATRYEQAKNLTDMAQFVIDENGDKEQYAEDTRQSKNLLSFLKLHTSKFDAMSDYDVAKMTEHMKGMYDAAAGRRGRLKKVWQSLKRGWFSTGAQLAMAKEVLNPGEIDIDTVKALNEAQRRDAVSNPAGINDVRDVHGVMDFVELALNATAENAPRMAANIAGATIGGIVGGPVGLRVGSGIGGFANNLGEAVNDQMEDGVEFDRGLAIAQALAYSGVDMAVPGVGKFFGKVASGVVREGAKRAGAEVVREGAKRAVLKNVAKEVAKSAAEEAISEPTQTVFSRLRRMAQTGSMLAEGETAEDAAWGALNEAVNAGLAGAVMSGAGGGISYAGARRSQNIQNSLTRRLVNNKEFNALSTEHQALVTRHLINDSLLATDSHAPVLTEADRAALTRQNADIEADLAADKGKGADNARKMLASITSDYAMEDKATIVEEARKNGTLRQIDAEALRATEREIEAPSDSERVYAYYDKATNQHLYRVTDGRDEVWLTAPNPMMKPAADGQTAFATLGEALNAMSENDAYNRARAEHSASKREVIKQAVQNLYGGEVNLVLADGVGGIADEGLRAEMEGAGPGVKAGYVADGNTLVVIPSNITSLGDLYTTLAHEAKHREIANYILGNGETVADGRKRLFGGRANAGAEEYAEHYGTSLEEANEEVAVERASVEDVVRAVQDADRTLLGAGVRRVFDAVRRKIGADIGVSERVITDADVRNELRFLWERGYLGGTKTANAKVTLTEDTENAVQQGEQERSINDSWARENGRKERIRRADEAAQRAAHDERGAQIAEAFAEKRENAPTSVPSAAEAQTAAPATESVEAVSRAAGETNQESAAPEVPVAENQETQTKENDNEARSVADEEQAKPEQGARGGEQAAEVRQGRVPQTGEVAPAEEGARSAVDEAAEQPPAEKPAQTGENAPASVPQGTAAVAPTETAKPAESEKTPDTAQGGEKRARLSKMSQAAQMRHYDVSRLTGVDFNEANLSVKDLEQFKSLYRDYSKGGTAFEHDAAASALKDFVNAHGEAVVSTRNEYAEGEKTLDTAKVAEKPTETPTEKPSAEDEAYQAWLAKYHLKDTPKRRREWEKKREEKPEAAKPAPKAEATPQAGAERQGGAKSASAKPAPKSVPPKPNAKKAAAIVQKFVSKDPTRGSLQHVHHDKETGVTVATNGRILIATKHGFDPNAEADTNPLPIPWKQVIPDAKSLGTSVTVNPATLAKTCATVSRLAKAVKIKEAFVRIDFGNEYALVDAEYMKTVAEAMAANGITELRTVTDAVGRSPIVAKNGDTTIVLMPMRSGEMTFAGRVEGVDYFVIDGLTGRILSAPKRFDAGIFSRDNLDKERKGLEDYVKKHVEEARNTNLYAQVRQAQKDGVTDPKEAYGDGWEPMKPEHKATFIEWMKTTDADKLAEAIADYIMSRDKSPYGKKGREADIAKIERRIAAEDEIDALMAAPNPADAEKAASAPAPKSVTLKNATAEDVAQIMSDRWNELHARDENSRTISPEQFRKGAGELLKNVREKNADAIALVVANGMNPASQRAFEVLTGVKLPKTQREQRAAIDRYCGITPEARAKIEADRKAEAKAKEEAERREAALREGEKLAGEYRIRLPGGKVATVKELIEAGWTMEKVKRGATYNLHLNDPNGRITARIDGKMREYIEDFEHKRDMEREKAEMESGVKFASEEEMDHLFGKDAEKPAAPSDTERPAEEAKPTTGSVENTENTTGSISAADAAYRTWLEKYRMEDTEARRAEFDRKVENGDISLPEAETPAAKREEEKPVKASVEFGAYNSRRYSKPWIARVTAWDVGKQPVIEFGNYIGDDDGGSAEIAAMPGDVVRYGQKDYRRNGTKKQYGIVQPDGSVLDCTDDEAAQVFRDGAARAKADAAETAEPAKPAKSENQEPAPKPTPKPEPAKPAAPSREAAVKAARTLGMDSALSDAQLRAKMREWGRHAEDPRFKARLDAAEVLLADRAAKGKAELTDEDKAMQRILGGTRFKRGEEGREYEDVVRRYHNADGTAKPGWMKATNGKPTKLTERQWVQVRTPSFKRWFGDWENDPQNASKVVDENGEPMVVYHGTRSGGFSKFDAEYNRVRDDGVQDKGFWFTDKLSIASTYSDSDEVLNAEENEFGEKEYNPDPVSIDKSDRIGGYYAYPQNYACFLNIRNIKTVDAKANHWDELPMGKKNPNYVRLYDLDDDTQERVAKEWAKETGIEPHYDEDGLWDNWEECLDGIIENWKSFTTEVDDYGNLIAEGEEPLFDKRTGKRVDNPEWTDTTRNLANRELGGVNNGILFKDVIDQGNAKWMRTLGERAANVFVVLSPTQIKSATDNAGAFDPQNPDIRFKRSGLYTGSAADYERPSLHAVGTGEGSQVYGWGLYASNVRGVAEGYAKAGAQDKASTPDELWPKYKGKFEAELEYDPVRSIALKYVKREGSVDEAIHYLRTNKFTEDAIPTMREAAEWLEANREDVTPPKVPPAHLYEQTFFTDRAPGDESHLLNWYEMDNLKPGNHLHEQVKWIRRQAKSEGVRLPKDLGGHGSDVYESIVNALGSQKAASEFLARAGIDGVKYPAMAYGKPQNIDGRKGWNYVSFRDDNITVDHKWRDGQMMFKRGEPNLPRATEDDPNVAFGTKEGIFQKTGIEREFARVSDVAVMKEGERRSRIVGEADGIISRVRRGEAPSSTDLATLIHTYADTLAELDRARNSGEDTEMLEKSVENIAEGLRLAGNRSGHALQMLKIGVGLSGVRDTYHYLESEVKAIKRKQGLKEELTDSERQMLEAQAAQLQAVNDKLNTELAKVNERNADLETMNRQLMELRRQMTRRINRAVKEKYGIVHEDAANSAFAGLGKFFKRTPNAVMKRGDEASASLNDEMRGYFSQALYAVGMDEGKARSLLNDNFGEDAARLFDGYLAELGATHETRSAKSEDVRKRTRIVPDAESARGKSRLDRLREATVTNLDALGEGADADAKHGTMAKYLRDFMKYVAKSEPSLTNEEVLSRMAEEAKLLDPDGDYDAQSMLSVVTGKSGFDMETRAKVAERVKTLEKALELARQGKLTEAAELAGINYASDVTLIENYENDLRQQLKDDADRLLDLMDAPPVGEEAHVEEINALKERIKETREEIAKFRNEGNLAEKREKAVETLKKKLAAKEAELAELAGKPIADADAAKAEVRSLRRRISALAREKRVIETLRGQIAEMERRIRENDFEAPPRQTQTAEQSPEVKRLMAERQRMRERFAAARRHHQYKQMGVAGQFAKDLWQILGETKGLVGSLDLSSMFRQGGQLTFAHPLIFARNFGKTLNAMKSAENAQTLMDEIMSRPNAPYYKAANLDFTDYGPGAMNPDDRFSIYDNDADGRWLLRQFRKVTKNRLVKAGVESSERAFSMYLNLMRADVFDAMIAGSTFGSPANMTQSQLEAVGRHLNIASQRGAFDKNGNLGKAVNFLNGFLWSPRNLISRFQFLAETAKLAVPGTNPYGDKTLRGMFAKELVRYLTGVAAITVFAKTLSDLLRDDDEPEEDIEFDPRSSQFLRVRFGETRVEFLSGLAQILTFLSRIGTRTSKTSRGQVREISPTDALGRFLRTKYSPGASLVWDLSTRESFSKQDLVFDSLWKSDKDEKSAYRHVAESFVPLTLTDVWDQTKYSGLKNAAVTTLATLLGAGVNTYDPKTYKQLKGDFTYFRNLYAEADADGRNELLRKCPFLRRTDEIEMAIKAVKEAEKYARQIEKQGGSVGEGLAETILQRRQRVVELMTAGGNR